MSPEWAGRNDLLVTQSTSMEDLPIVPVAINQQHLMCKHNILFSRRKGEKPVRDSWNSPKNAQIPYNVVFLSACLGKDILKRAGWHKCISKCN